MNQMRFCRTRRNRIDAIEGNGDTRTAGIIGTYESSVPKGVTVQRNTE
jgi:hypothetical protein